MKVLVCGDRNWTDYDMIYNVLKHLPKSTTIIEGEANGADKLSRKAAEALGMIVEPYPAHWRHTSECPRGCKEMVGRPAGAIRNTKMLKVGNPGLVLAFHHDINTSKGTKNMVLQAKKAGVPYRIFPISAVNKI